MKDQMVGSFQNRMMERAPAAVKPEVGMGATRLSYTDRDAYTVVGVSASGKTCRVQRDKATRLDRNGMSESQSYSYEPDTSAPVITLRLTRRNRWMGEGAVFVMGVRAKYHDYSF